MNAPSIDIKNMLEAESFGLVFGTNLFVAIEPSDPVDCVTIFDVPGDPPQLTFDNQKQENPAINIQVRNKDYATGYTLAEQIKDSLHGRANEEWGGTLYMIINCISGPFALEFDENRRICFSINFNVRRR